MGDLGEATTRSQAPSTAQASGRVGRAGSEATGWHHYDGAREITRERSRRGRQTVGSNCVQNSASRGGFSLDNEETAGFPFRGVGRAPRPRMLSLAWRASASPAMGKAVSWYRRHCSLTVRAKAMG